MIQGSIAAANSSLVDIARSVNDVDIVKKKVTVDYDDFNRRIEEIETAIGANFKSKTSMYSAGEQKATCGWSSDKDKHSCFRDGGANQISEQ